MLLAVCLLLGGCSHANSNLTRGNAIIDWVDFVKLDGRSYSGLHQSVIRNPKDITNQVVGKVKFNVQGVSNPSYHTKDGDASFLQEGSKLYRVQGYEPDVLIAAKDDTTIGGYRLYRNEESGDLLRDWYEDVPLDKVGHAALYRDQETSPYVTLRDEELKSFIQLLEEGEDVQDYRSSQPADPLIYRMVLYTDSPIAYSFVIYGDHVYFAPAKVRLVDDAMRQWLYR